MAYMKHESYRILYAKYYDKPVQKFFDLADPKDKVVLDLCGGNGVLSLAAKEAGARRVVLIEECRGMLDGYEKEGVEVCWGDVLEELGNLGDGFANIAYCRQSINYWIRHPYAVKLLASKIVSGGSFVFNTFNTKPPIFPSPKEYTYRENDYMELSWYDPGLNKVHHVQICRGYPTHVTQFDWVSDEDFHSIFFLNNGFALESFVDGRTTMYRATRI